MSIQPDIHSEQSKLIYIDSEDAEADFTPNDLSGESADFLLDLEESIICPANQEMFVSMYSCSIPYSFYDIREDVNDKIRFITTIVATATSITWEIDFGDSTMTIAPYYATMASWGNYNVTTLSTQANLIFTQLLRAGQVASGHANANSTIEFVYAESQGRFIITFKDFPTGLTIQLHQQGAGYMDSEIGLPEEDTTQRLFAFDASTGNYFYQTPNVVDTSGSTHGIFLRTNLSSNSTMASDTGRSTDILAHIPILVNSGEIIHSPPQSNLHKSKVGVKTINHIHIQLKDERNRPLNFNGLHTHIVLLIDFVYDRKKIIPSPYFRRQKEHFQESIDHQKTLLKQQGFKGNLSVRSKPRSVGLLNPDIHQEPTNPRTDIDELKKEEEKMEDVEDIAVSSSGGLSSEDVSSADASTLLRDTI